MKRELHWLFFFVCFCACMWAVKKAYAQDLKPVAVCKDGVCVMSEADFKKLQEYIALVQKVSDANDDKAEQVNRDLNELSGALANCKNRLAQKKVSQWE